jgi:hypothetical protein
LLLCYFGPRHTLIRAANPAKSFVSPTSKKFSCNPFVSPTYAKTRGVGGTFNLMIFTNAPLRLSNPGGYNRLENLAPNFVLSTEHPTRMLILSEPGESKDHSSSDSATLNCKPAFLTPAFTTTSITIVGAPTFSCPCRNAVMRENFVDAGLQPRRLGLTEVRRLQELEHDRACRSRNSTGHPVKDAHPERARRGGRVEGSLRFFRIFLNLKLTTDHLELRKSNHSRTYAKTRGWG